MNYPEDFEPHAPEKLQEVPLELLQASGNQIRQFVEREALWELKELYEKDAAGEEVILPSPPVARFESWDEPLEVLAGERRVTASHMAGKESVLVRVGAWDPEEAFRYIIQSNHFEPITATELAQKAAEMHFMGYSDAEISDLLGGIRAYRYIEVGKLVLNLDFTTAQKLCDPPITWWYEASQLGEEHFERCFRHWDAGAWDLKECKKEFRHHPNRRLPLDNMKKGLRLSVSPDSRRILVKGEIRLDLLTDAEIREIISIFCSELQATAKRGISHRDGDGFGPRFVHNINPDTLEDYYSADAD